MIFELELFWMIFNLNTADFKQSKFLIQEKKT